MSDSIGMPQVVIKDDPGKTWLKEKFPLVIMHFRDEMEWIKGQVDQMPSGGTFVEVGVALGGLTVLLWSHVYAKDGQYVVVDHFEGTPSDGESEGRTHLAIGRVGAKGRFLVNMVRARISSNIRMVEADSVHAARVFDDGTLDIVYLDAGHTYDEVRADIQAWWPKVKPGEWLMGHDYHDHGNGVQQAVDRHCDECGLVCIRGATRCWKVQKT